MYIITSKSYVGGCVHRDDIPFMSPRAYHTIFYMLSELGQMSNQSFLLSSLKNPFCGFFLYIKNAYILGNNITYLFTVNVSAPEVFNCHSKFSY